VKTPKSDSESEGEDVKAEEAAQADVEEEEEEEEKEEEEGEAQSEILESTIVELKTETLVKNDPGLAPATASPTAEDAMGCVAEIYPILRGFR